MLAGEEVVLLQINRNEVGSFGGPCEAWRRLDDDELVRSLWLFVRSLQDVADLDWTDQIERMRDGFSAAVAGIGVRCFAYHIIRCPGLGPAEGSFATMITTFPERWTERCANEGYERDDPVLSEALHNPLPFVWSQLARAEDLNRRQRRFFEAAREAGLDACLTVPIHVQGEVAALSVAPREGRETTVLRHAHLLYFMSHSLHLKLRRPLVEVSMTMSSRRRSMLSPRETEVLELTAKGKSTSEISWALGISQKSVDFHIEGARRKLQVSNRTHAVARALMLGLLSLD